MATVNRVMADPDPSSDPDGDAGESRATPRLANPPDADTAGADDADTTDQSVADPESLREPEPIEPEPLRAENAAFVLLGALGTIGLLATVIVPGLL